MLVQYRHIEQQACGVDQQELYLALHSMLQQLITEGQRQGLVRAGDAAILAALSLELLSPRAFQNLTRVVDTCAEDAAEQAVRFLLGGLGIR